MIAAYYTYQFCTLHTIAHDKPRPESHPSNGQVQNVNISTSNQNAYAPTSFPDLPKIDLSSFKKGMVIINALFRAHPENYCDDAQKVMMVAAQLKDDTREDFLNLLEEDPDLILLYEAFLEHMDSTITPAGAKVQAYMGLLCLSQGRDDLEAYIQRFSRLSAAAEVPDNISDLHFRNSLNNHHTNLMRHHHCNLHKDELLAIARRMDFSQPQKYGPPRNYQPQGNQTAAHPHLNMALEEYQYHVRAGLCFYYHQNGHLSKDCPTRSSTAQNPTISAINSSSQSYPIIQAILLYSDQVLKIPAFMDSGATHNYIKQCHE
ncbi:hypothetical protein DSO57_1014743 [Entomophthora muscae]|uniref:Uncharacterized protein n=1 Tax=Entomophthora muscae TaxID=34485 RepID=A0ACC2SUG7_9FUNG|nr:hypothetical protein DSO57_1014743 [Entomophthora muscae]